MDLKKRLFNVNNNSPGVVSVTPEDRITEDGELRITEAGETRILERG